MNQSSNETINSDTLTDDQSQIKQTKPKKKKANKNTMLAHQNQDKNMSSEEKVA